MNKNLHLKVIINSLSLVKSFDLVSMLQSVASQKTIGSKGYVK